MISSGAQGLAWAFQGRPDLVPEAGTELAAMQGDLTSEVLQVLVHICDEDQDGDEGAGDRRSPEDPQGAGRSAATASGEAPPSGCTRRCTRRGTSMDILSGDATRGIVLGCLLLHTSDMVCVSYRECLEQAPPRMLPTTPDSLEGGGGRGGGGTSGHLCWLISAHAIMHAPRTKKVSVGR